MRNTVAAIDFGTSKIVTLIAESTGTQRCEIVGAGIAGYEGFRVGEGWCNPAALSQHIQESLNEARKKYTGRIDKFFVGVPGGFSKVYTTEITVNLAGPDPRVTPDDITSVFKAAEDKFSQLPGQIIHVSPAYFQVDNGKKTLTPVNMKGRQLKGMVSTVIADQFFINDVSTRMTEMNMQAAFFSSIVGESMLFIPKEDRDVVSVLIDVGYLTTDVIVAEGDAVTFHRCIDAGGVDIAIDLADAFNVDFDAVEEYVKQQYVFCVDHSNATFDIPALDGRDAVSLPGNEVESVIEGSTGRICDLIHEALESSGVKLSINSNIFLTGGGVALNRGSREFLTKRLNLDKAVRDIPKKTTRLNDPIYSSSLGVMDLIIDAQDSGAGRDKPTGIKAFVRSILGMD